MTETLEQALNEALAIHETFRRLGFPADDIFVGADIEKFYVELRSQGKTFIVTCGLGNYDDEEIRHLWPVRATAWNTTMTFEEREAIYRNSSILSRAVQLLSALKQRGFIWTVVNPLDEPMATQSRGRA
ncbi:MAG: hypothetical protein Q7R39_11060 [Dehalococcoidia bacterium]|nr:hypothetical protein [Dehalococcoidia bacterium]